MIHIPPSIEGLSLGGCVQCFVAFVPKVLGSLQVSSVRKTCSAGRTVGPGPLGCAGDIHIDYLRASSSEPGGLLQEELMTGVMFFLELGIKVIFENNHQSLL